MFDFNNGSRHFWADFMVGRGGPGGRFPGGRGGRGGFGHGGFGPGGFGPDGFGRGHGGARLGRLFGSGDLKLFVLSLIERQPRHGYDIIKYIEDMFAGQYSPSPGAIYPTLTLLEEQGFVSVTEEGGKKLYTITAAGTSALDEQRAAVEALTERLQLVARSLAGHALPDEVRHAMVAIKQHVMAHHRSWDREEAKRVVDILRKAVDAIAERKP